MVIYMLFHSNCSVIVLFYFFFFNDTATTEIYTLSLHDALPIYSIVIKDMSGILLPEVAYELVKELKSVLTIPLELHTHATAGLASMTYFKAKIGRAHV